MTVSSLHWSVWLYWIGRVSVNIKHYKKNSRLHDAFVSIVELDASILCITVEIKWFIVFEWGELSNHELAKNEEESWKIKTWLAGLSDHRSGVYLFMMVKANHVGRKITSNVPAKKKTIENNNKCIWNACQIMHQDIFLAVQLKWRNKWS